MAPLLLVAGAVGAAAMYLFDPDRGRRRRALLRDQAVRASTKSGDVLDAGARDLAHRVGALPRRAISTFRHTPVTDDILVERVRSKMGRYVAHPGAIEVNASDGQVTLTGSILAHEHKAFLEALRAVSGVADVIDQLAVHKTAEGVPELQGGRRRPGERTELLQYNWSPGTRLVTATAAGAFALYALRSSGIVGIVAFAASAALLARSAANKPFRQIAGMRGRKGIDIQKTLHIDAPVERVFEFLSNYENFPQFMHNVRDVEKRPNGQSHWRVAGPAGTTVEWDAVTTRHVPNEHIAWRTVPGSTLQHAGMINVEPFDSGTRVHVRMSYNPPAGYVGHAVAKLTGSDPKTDLDEDLMRLKSTLERGQTPHDAAQPA